MSDSYYDYALDQEKYRKYQGYYSSESGSEEDTDVCTIHNYSRCDAIYRLSNSTQLCADCVKQLAIPRETMYGCSVCRSSDDKTCFTLKKSKFRICEKCYKILLWKMDMNMNINE